MTRESRGKWASHMLRAGAVMVLLLAGVSERAYADPIYWVKTQAVAMPGGYEAVAAYNATPFFAPTGTSQVGSYFFANNHYFNNTTAGTVDASGRLTASWDAVTSAANASREPGIPAGSYPMSAYAAADLAGGSLKASGWANTPGHAGIAQAGFKDVIHYTVEGAGLNTVTNVNLRFSLDGLVSGTGNASYDWDMAFGGGYISAKAAGTTGQLDFVSTSYPKLGGWVSGGFGSLDDPSNLWFEGVYALLGPSGSIDVSGYLHVAGQSGMSADFSNTALYELNVPDSVSYTSASGVFLQGQGGPSPVPDPGPGNLSLIALGLLGQGVRRWRRRA